MALTQQSLDQYRGLGHLLSHARMIPPPLLQGAGRVTLGVLAGRVDAAAALGLSAGLYNFLTANGYLPRQRQPAGPPALPPGSITLPDSVLTTIGQRTAQLAAHALYFDPAQLEMAGRAASAALDGQLTLSEAEQTRDMLGDLLRLASEFWRRPALDDYGQEAVRVGHSLSPGVCPTGGNWYPATDEHGHLVPVCPTDPSYRYVKSQHAKGLGVPRLPGSHGRSVATAGDGPCCVSCSVGGPCEGCAPGECRGGCAA